MVKISDGEIQRKLPAGISLDTYVYQTSRSVLTHRLRRKKKSVPLDEALSLGGAEMIWDQLVFHMLTNCMLDIVSGDPTLTKIVVIWSECPDMKPNEVALKLGIPIEEMRCAQVRLRGILLRKGADQWLPKRKK
jgi:hypothetical protein